MRFIQKLRTLQELQEGGGGGVGAGVTLKAHENVQEEWGHVRYQKIVISAYW